MNPAADVIERKNTRNPVEILVIKSGEVKSLFFENDSEACFLFAFAADNAANGRAFDAEGFHPHSDGKTFIGSGKTVVACMMLLAAVENGYQGAIMAPTEILAQQHFNNFIKWLAPMGVSVGLFLGSNKKKVRDKLLCDLKNGQLDVAIGTHALIQENVEFKNLGAIVIDEQHRFGVKQRKDLAQKGTNPQLLTMTATPIPRTLALMLYGKVDDLLYAVYV